MRSLIALLCGAVIAATACRAPAQDGDIGGQLRDWLALPRLEDLRATRDRPLFEATRRPARLPSAPELPPSSPAQASVPPLGLEGIVMGESEGIVVFRNQTSNQVQRMRLGETFEGWTLVEIDPRFVVLRDGNTTVKLQLFAADSANPPRKF